MEAEVEVVVRGSPSEPSDPPCGGEGLKMIRAPRKESLFGKRAGVPGSAFGACVVGRVAVCLSGSLPSESGVGREPGSMSFPCGTISASRKLPFPGDFCGEMGRMLVVTPKPAGLGDGTGVPG